MASRFRFFAIGGAAQAPSGYPVIAAALAAYFSENEVMLRNVGSQRFVVYAYYGPNATNPGNPVTGDAANITALLSKDGAAASATNDVNPTELGNGLYAFDATQAETDAAELVLRASSSTANVLLMPLVIRTGVNVEQINAVTVLGAGTSGDLWRA